jgi:hypothetical protein
MLNILSSLFLDVDYFHVAYNSTQEYYFRYLILGILLLSYLSIINSKQLRRLSPRANYTDVATAACRRS